MSEDRKNWDWKQLSTGAGGSILALFLLQDRGINMLNEQQETSNQVIIEKTIANAHRINALENAVKDINVKLDSNFKELRAQMKEDVDSIKDDIKSVSVEKWTKTDHNEYARRIGDRVLRLESDVRALKIKGE